MREVQNDMDKVFRDKLGDFQKQPPEEIWDGIKAGIGKPRRKVLIPLWQAAAGMAIIITAGSLYYFLNGPDQSNLAEEFLIVPRNVQTPGAEKNTLPEVRQNEKSTAVDPVFEKDTKTLYPELKKDESFLNTSDHSNPVALADNSQSDSKTEFNSVKLLSGNVSVRFMNEAFLQSAHVDKIPRNKRNNTASWDMLAADLDSEAEEEISDIRLLLTAQVSPTYSYRDIGNIGKGGASEYNETGRINYSGGLQFGIETSERLSLHAGVMYARLGYNINQVGSFEANRGYPETDALATPERLSTVYVINNSIGTISNEPRQGIFSGNADYASNVKEFSSNILPDVGTNIQVESIGSIEQYFQYLEVPFLLRYKIFDRKLGVNLLGGISTNILVGNKAILSDGDMSGRIGSSHDIKNFNYMGNMGLGFDYTIGKNLLFTVEPQFKYFLNSINQSNLIVNRPYMLGMFTGVRYVW